MQLDYNVIKRKIEKESCKIHHEKAVFKKSIKGFTIQTCCQEFEKIIGLKSEKIIAEETKKAVETSLKKMFK